MSNRLHLSTEFKVSSETKPEAIRAYQGVLKLCQIHRNDMSVERIESALIMLAPFMPGLDTNDELTSKDKVCIYAQYAKLLVDIGDLDAALQCTQAALRFDPSDVKTANQSAAILRRIERQPEAIELLENARKIDPKDKFTLTLLAGCYEDIHQHMDARKCYLATLVHNPEDHLAKRRLRELTQF